MNIEIVSLNNRKNEVYETLVFARICKNCGKTIETKRFGGKKETVLVRSEDQLKLANGDLLKNFSMIVKRGKHKSEMVVLQ